MVYQDIRHHSERLSINFTTIYRTPTKIKIAWTLNPEQDTEELYPYSYFNVYFNEIPIGSFCRINTDRITDSVDGVFYLEHYMPNYAKTPRGYYKIEAVAEDGSSKTSLVFSVYPTPDQYIKKISKEQLFRLMNTKGRQVDSVPVLHYVRKRFGTPCVICNPSGETGPAKSNCPTCIGTGFTGGFHNPPVLQYVTYSASISKMKTDQGNRVASELTHQAEMSAELSIVDINDYLWEINPPHRLWCVSGVSISEAGGCPVSIFANLQLEESSHPLWEIEKPPITLPTRVYYYSDPDLREVYLNAANSVGESPSGPIGELTSEAIPTVIRTPEGIVEYRFLLSGLRYPFDA